jgi:hypothetical protein
MVLPLRPIVPALCGISTCTVACRPFPHFALIKSLPQLVTRKRALHSPPRPTAHPRSTITHHTLSRRSILTHKRHMPCTHKPKLRIFRACHPFPQKHRRLLSPSPHIMITLISSSSSSSSSYYTHPTCTQSHFLPLNRRPSLIGTSSGVERVYPVRPAGALGTTSGSTACACT